MTAINDDTDFSAHPPTITELRGQKDKDVRHWTPRDALISMLRAIDAKEIDPDVAFVAIGQTGTKGDGKGDHVKFRVAGPNTFLIDGVLAAATRLWGES